MSHNIRKYSKKRKFEAHDKVMRVLLYQTG